MYINLWHNDTYTAHEDDEFDAALADFAQHPFDHFLTIDTETGRTYDHRELELLWKDGRAEIASENKHNRSLAAAE